MPSNDPRENLPVGLLQDEAPSPSGASVAGTLHLYVAFDWGDEIDLELARRIMPAEVRDLPRRRRTPSSIAYRPPPLRTHLAPVSLSLPELGALCTPAEAIVFDFAAVSVALHVPFRLPPASLLQLASGLAEPRDLVQAARQALKPLYAKLLPAIQNPSWRDDLSEEYFVFHLPPDEAPLPPPAELLASQAGWLAGLLRLEADPLSPEEIAEAVRTYLRYSPTDLFIPDWAAAVLIDRNCDETLQTIEFANLQLLEYRHIDNRLDKNLASVYGMIDQLAQSRPPLWRHHGRSLRSIGELKVEATGLFERTGNVFKLVGDQYLARVYRLVAERFHLEGWERGILRKLEVVEGVYRVVSDQADTRRAESIEIIVALLIVIEILLAIFRH